MAEETAARAKQKGYDVEVKETKENLRAQVTGSVKATASKCGTKH